jgi:hypothetical protein
MTVLVLTMPQATAPTRSRTPRRRLSSGSSESCLSRVNAASRRRGVLSDLAADPRSNDVKQYKLDAAQWIYEA